MAHAQTADDRPVVHVSNPSGASRIVLVCEHASHFIPADLNNLGLDATAQQSHAAWDPGALAVAEIMSDQLDAVLVASTVSRLVYDCNRPPEAPSAMPSQSEAFKIPGNADLTPAQRQTRAATYYEPFRAELGTQIGLKTAPVIVTVHSFTPVYHGTPRGVEIGFLHDTDSRLADALLALPAMSPAPKVDRNQPYGPQDGVTHTLKVHALPQGHLNVMIEVRNDLIATPKQQSAVGETLVNWIRDALGALNVDV